MFSIRTLSLILFIRKVGIKIPSGRIGKDNTGYFAHFLTHFWSITDVKNLFKMCKTVLLWVEGFHTWKLETFCNKYLYFREKQLINKRRLWRAKFVFRSSSTRRLDIPLSYLIMKIKICTKFISNELIIIATNRKGCNQFR